MKFQNPLNNNITETKYPWLWTLLFGCFYFLKHGAVLWSLIAFFLAVITWGLSWFVFPFFGSKIIRGSYLKRGWKEISDE